MASNLPFTLPGLDTFTQSGSGTPNSFYDAVGFGTNPADNPAVASQTKTTEVTVGTADTTTTTTQTTVVGGAVGAWLTRGAIIILGMVFVAVGLGKFKGG